MAKLHIQHVKSNVLDKAPSADTLNYGEIAINYNVGSPAIYIKDSTDNIVKFISEPYFLKIVGTGVTENDGETFTPLSEIIQQDEMTISAAFNDLNGRKADKTYVDDAVSSITIDVDTHLDSASTNPVENRVIYNALQNVDIDVDDHLDSGSTNPVENRVLYNVIKEDELIYAAAVNDLNTRVNKAVTGATVDGIVVPVTNHVLSIPAGLPDVTAADNGKILRVVNGAWQVVSPTTVYSGSGTPSQNLGVDGDIYLQTTS